MCGTFYERPAIWVHQNYEGALVGSCERQRELGRGDVGFSKRYPGDSI